MKTLHLFQIAINDYQPPLKPLSGCLNDMNGLAGYFRRFASGQGWAFRLHQLADGAATRQAVIDGFGHFDGAGAGDVCVLTFSGHGSCWAAPPAFWHLEHDRLNESIVCHDSRRPGGRDLMDKELSWLIWKATYGRNVHFLVLMDCCHSGTNVRLDYGEVRKAPCVKEVIPAEDYLGFADYEEVAAGRFTPPQGPYIHLAAARPAEYAREISLEGETYGVFTYYLLRTLEQTGRRLTYAELLSRVNRQVHQQYETQSPQMEASHPGMLSAYFLTGENASGQPRYLVHSDRRKGWIVDAGAIHGLTPGTPDAPTTFELTGEAMTASVTGVRGAYSLLAGLEQADPGRIYEAALTSGGASRLRVAYAGDADPEGVSWLTGQWTQQAPAFCRLTGSPADADYLIHVRDDQYYVTPRDENRPLFSRINGYGPRPAGKFLARLEAVGRWRHLLDLANPCTSIQNHELHLDLYRSVQLGAHEYEDESPAELIDWRGEVRMPYHWYEGKWHEPAFRLRISNTGSRRLWISALYLGDDFSICNDLLQREELAPGEDIWLKDKGHYLTVPLRIDQPFHDLGVNAITEYLKIVVSTEEFYTDDFNQKGLTPDADECDRGEERGKGRDRDGEAEPSDWTTFDVHFRIVRPVAPRALPPAPPLFGMTVIPPAGFSAHASLNTYEEACALHPVPVVSDIGERGDFTPCRWTAGNHRSPGLSVLELYRVAGPDRIGRETPLVIRGFQRPVVPFACDAESGRFRELAHEAGEGELRLFELPAPLPGEAHGYGEVIRVFGHVA